MTQTANGNSAGSRPLALVTGASSGIGLELARLLAEHEYDVIVAAEDPGIQQAAAEVAASGAGGAQVEPVRVDLATKEGVEQLASRVGGRALDALCLNAGVGLGGAFLDQDLDRVFNIIDLNVRSTVHLAYRLLPAMVARGSGHVLFTSSIAAQMPGSFQAVYNASKAFDQSFAEAVRDEIKDSGVTVTALQPGATDTNFFHRAGMEDTKVGADKKDSPAAVAEDGFDAMMKGKDHVVGGSAKNLLQSLLSQITPDPLKAKMHRSMAEPGSASKA